MLISKTDAVKVKKPGSRRMKSMRNSTVSPPRDIHTICFNHLIMTCCECESLACEVHAMNSMGREAVRETTVAIAASPHTMLSYKVAYNANPVCDKESN